MGILVSQSLKLAQLTSILDTIDSMYLHTYIPKSKLFFWVGNPATMSYVALKSSRCVLIKELYLLVYKCHLALSNTITIIAKGNKKKHLTIFGSSMALWVGFEAHKKHPMLIIDIRNQKKFSLHYRLLGDMLDTWNFPSSTYIQRSSTIILPS